MRRIASPKWPDAGQHDGVGALHAVAARRTTRTVGAQPLQRLDGAAQVAHLVVEHRRRAGLTGDPLVDGTPVDPWVARDGDGRAPARRALKLASMAWCAFARHEQAQVQGQAARGSRGRA